MAMTFERSWALLLWPVCVSLLVWLARRVGVRRPWAVPLRLIVITVLVIALSNPTQQKAAAAGERLVILVDRSASAEGGELDQVMRSLARPEFALPETMVVQFAESPQFVPDPTKAWPAPIGWERATNLEAALDFAGQLLSGGRGSVLLVSDGTATAGDASAAANRLATDGVRVDVLRLRPAPIGVDVGVDSVQVPAALWMGEPFAVTVRLYSVGAVAASLRLIRDGAPLAEQALDLPAGETRVTFSAVADAEGLTAFEARVSVAGDERPQNDVGWAVGLVRPPAAALVVTRDQEADERLRAAMVEAGIRAESLSPEALPMQVQSLLTYQVMVLDDVSAGILSPEQLAALQAYTYAHGRGLVVVGGPSAFTLGAYKGTPLEEMLPVLLEPPERTERPPAGLLLIVDKSSSMIDRLGESDVTKLDLAKDAAMRAAEILQPDDYLGVLAFDTKREWRVPIGKIGEGLAMRAVLDAISSIRGSGGTDMLTPLEVGIRELTAVPIERRHVVLLSDGKSEKGAPPDFQRVVEMAASAGITVSTIAVGGDADRPLMAGIAEWGGGRYHYADSSEDVPRMMLAESQAVTSDAIQRGTVRPQIAIPHPLVRDFAAADFPTLQAYVALTPRPEADTVLTAPLGDPLLAAWQYGLGRVLTWTSDSGGEWTAAWPDWAEWPRFWAQLVRHALPDPAQGSLLAEARVEGSLADVTLLAAGEDGKGINLARARLTVAAPDGVTSRVELPQSAPGEYSATFTVPSPGAYRALLTLDKGDQHWETPMGFSVAYPPELNPRLVPDSFALDEIAAITGGSTIGSPAEIVPPVAAPSSTIEYGPWLIAVALACWPIEIAIRRRWMPWPGA